MRKMWSLGKSPGFRRAAAIVFGMGIMAMVISLASGSVSAPTAPRHDLTVPVASSGGCQTEVGGKILRLQPGQGIETADGWRNCQIYDGHPLIVYGARPSSPSARDTGD